MSTPDIITRCPQCNTAFRVTPNQLSVADGVVRCGSCLAVFKAVDYKTEKQLNTGDTTNTESTSQTDSNHHDVEDEVSDDALIEDERESVLNLSDDIYDLDIRDKSRDEKTSLFGRKLKPVSQQTREKADESWALDMLADLEDDDDIQPIQVKRHQNKEAHANPIEPEEVFIDQPSPFSNEPATKSLDSERQAETEKKETPEKKRGFSFLKRNNKKKEKEPVQDDIEELDFDYDDVTDIEDDTETIRPADTLITELDAPLKYISSNDDDYDANALYFDQDEYTETQEQDKTEPVIAVNMPQSTTISDEAIENAMYSRTSYASEDNKLLSNIQPAPVEMEWYEYSRTKNWLWAIGALLLCLLIGLQFALFRFDYLSKQTKYRPYYQSACNIFGCQVPDIVDLKQILISNVELSNHDTQKDAIVLIAILINNARFEQPYPALKLEFLDKNKKRVASRELQPNEYLQGELAGAKYMPINQKIQLSLDIIAPDKRAETSTLKPVKPKNIKIN